jgi:hypothetical protein
MYICGEKKEKLCSVIIVENEIVHTYHGFLILMITLRGVDMEARSSSPSFLLD